jgi:hypothetical protein
MRRRSQAEMDQLVRDAAGFEKLGQRIDEWGIFTVSIARRKRRMNTIGSQQPIGPIRWQHSVAWLLLLAPLFFLSYGWTNQLAASRGSEREHRVRLGAGDPLPALDHRALLVHRPDLRLCPSWPVARRAKSITTACACSPRNSSR